MLKMGLRGGGTGSSLTDDRFTTLTPCSWFVLPSRSQSSEQQQHVDLAFFIPVANARTPVTRMISTSYSTRIRPTPAPKLFRRFSCTPWTTPPSPST